MDRGRGVWYWLGKRVVFLKRGTRVEVGGFRWVGDDGDVWVVRLFLLQDRDAMRRFGRHASR